MPRPAAQEGDLDAGALVARRAAPELRPTRWSSSGWASRQACPARRRPRPALAARRLIFGTRWGRPLEPRNLTRIFGKLCDDHGIRRVPLHGHVNLDTQRAALNHLDDELSG